MDDGKPTGPQAKWWSRPAARRADHPEREAAPGPEAGTPESVPSDETGARDARSGPAAPAPAAPSKPPVAPAPAAPSEAPVVSAPAVPEDRESAARPPEPGTDVPRPRAAGQPLHEPDEYRTPPYGDPGPWAPAPPVQRPTPAHGTVVPPGAGGPAPRYAAPGGGVTPPPVPAPTPGDGFPLPPPQPQAHAPQPPHGAPEHPAPEHVPAPAPPPQQTQTHTQPQTQWLQYDPWGAPGEPLTRPGPEGGDPGRRKKRRGGAFMGALLLALVAGGIGGGVGAYVERNGGLTTVELPQADRDNGDRAPESVAGIAASALPSVVTLHVSGAAESGTGTGFVLDAQGHILTNNHVVAPAGSGGDITVTFSTGETASAELVGKDSGYDLAVVKVRGVSGLKPLPLGNSDNVQVGDPVVAIGAPFDLSNTVTSGIISAKQRPITAGGEKGDGSDISYVDALQTDAPINPGNSGGPLVDTRAHVIGINSAIRAADSGRGPESGGQSGSIGLGFAIPINQGKRVAEELISTGRATHPVIGVTLDMKYTGDGAKVGAKDAEGGPAVAADGPAAKAGIRSGDVITHVEGQRVHSGEELIVKIRAHRPGDALELKLTRGGAERTVTLKLGSASGA
ncbi:MULTISPECIES: trypsin-like peptidase domain-containing protein [unclassified Streptomyces]|uniref:trypsin-like peptidase domain-containing protein n=1 Tax=unclassified Streptomyces TaxID=2593676 RepID=UPI0006ADB60E|nr:MULTISPECIES: trypsin-like peptidase domain-containing protein [unclassified Streptomyces]KOU49835.1 protease [Streptomyces sp. MMG1522]MBD3548417.1 trypsin-like peptidase domain-containing protein [Streptomyces sp. JV180]